MPSVPTVLEEFRAGVTACLRSWSVLRTAVESGWGGNESAKKADDLRQYIYENFDGKSYPAKLDIQDLEDNLAIYMEEEFSITLEDNSEREVSDAIFRLYEAAHRGDCTLARQMVTQCNEALAVVSSHPSQVRTMEHDEDDDDDQMDSGTAAPMFQNVSTNLSPELYSKQSLFGTFEKPKQSVPSEPARQLGEHVPEPALPVLDDDGFAPVASKKKGR